MPAHTISILGEIRNRLVKASAVNQDVELLLTPVRWDSLY